MDTKLFVFITALVATSSIAVIFIALYAVSGSDELLQCGGSLQGDSGKFMYDGSNQESNCLWIISLNNGNGIRLTVEQLQTELTLYSDGLHNDGTLIPLT